MPQIDIEALKAQALIQPKNVIMIEGEANDITDRGDIDEDTLSMAGEPTFPSMGIRDREEVELGQAVGRLPHGPLRQLDSARLLTKWQLIEQLTTTIPLNQFDLPDFYYRADMLDHQLVLDGLNAFKAGELGDRDPTTTAILSPPRARSDGIQDIVAHLDAARVNLSYDEGFPSSVTNGRPFWDQLEFESKESHDAFMFYLEQDGARRIADLLAYDLRDVKSWYHTYYWSFRVKSFDLYRVAHANRQKLQRMLKTEDSHYRIAERLMGQINVLLGEGEFLEKLKTLEPEKLISVLDKVVKIQRISAGLNAAGGQAETIVAPKAPTTNIIMQQITQGDRRESEDTDDFDMLVDDPSLVDMAQNLIIQSQKNAKL